MMTDNAKRWIAVRNQPATSMWDTASLYHPANEAVRHSIVAYALAQRELAWANGLDISEVLSEIAAVLRPSIPP